MLEELHSTTKYIPAPLINFLTRELGKPLQGFESVDKSVSLASKLGFPLHPDRPKNWDTIMAVTIAMSCGNERSAILDVGGEYYSSFLPSLRSLGYCNLMAINPVFPGIESRNGIKFRNGIAEKTNLPGGFFSSISCLSVIEHGVKIELFFAEQARLLRKGGLLFVSFDYWCDTIDTRNLIAYNQPITIFNNADVFSFIEIAGKFGLHITHDLDLSCDKRAVEWKDYKLEYTFMALCFKKV